MSAPGTKWGRAELNDSEFVAWCWSLRPGDSHTHIGKLQFRRLLKIATRALTMPVLANGTTPYKHGPLPAVMPETRRRA